MHSQCIDSFFSIHIIFSSFADRQATFFCQVTSISFFCKGLPCRFFRKGPLTSLNVWKDWFGASLHLPPHSPVQWMRFSIWRWKYQDCCNNDFCFSDQSSFNQTSKDKYNAQNDPFAVKKITLYHVWQLMFFSGGEKTLYLLTYHFCNFELQRIEVKFVVIKMPPTQNVTAGNIDATSFHLSPDFADYHQHPDK